MKLSPALVSALLIVLVSSASAAEQSMLARVTTYWRSEGCGLRASSNGARLQNGHCAVDPKRIPFGSKVVFPDTTCVAVDSGPDVANRKAARTSGHTAAERSAIVIDRFFETKQQAMAWERSHSHFMMVSIIAPESHSARRIADAGASSSRSPALLGPVSIGSRAFCDFGSLFESAAPAAAKPAKPSVKHHS